WPKKKCIVVARERGGQSMVMLCSEPEAAARAPMFIAPGSIVHTDEAREYNQISAYFDHRRINHSVAYSAKGGFSTNWAESFFARMRRSEFGVHHSIAGPYLAAYAAENSWREDNRRVPNGEQFLSIAAAGLHHPVSRQWKGYWQRRKAA
ncbi:MAG: family transposase, partial [Sphingomonas bacterium]|nr:family transposase [Sphingomonas bacterium]